MAPVTHMAHRFAASLVMFRVLSSFMLATAVPTIRVHQDVKYIFPILTFGPHNEKRDFRHMLALARELDAGVMLTGVFKHYMDKQEAKHTRRRRQQHSMEAAEPSLPACFDAPQGFMPMTQVIDRTSIDAWVPTATVEQLKAKGWDGHLDALVYPDDNITSTFMHKYIQRSCQASGVLLPDAAPRYAVPPALKCKASNIMALHSKLQGHRYIGLLVVVLGMRDRVSDLRKEPAQPPTSRCRRITYLADRVLRPSAWLMGIADTYIQQHLTPPSDQQHTGYLAVHVRPYPDTCLELWKRGQLESVSEEQARAACDPRLPDLHQRLGPCVRQAMQAAGVGRVFILTHPAIRSTVDSLLRAAGVHAAQYLDVQRLQNLTHCEDNSATFQLLVEEAIAVRAPVFLGSHTTSITHNIVYERLSIGHTRNEFFEHMEC